MLLMLERILVQPPARRAVPAHFLQGRGAAGAGTGPALGLRRPDPRESIASAARGVNLPWTLVASAVLGAFLMVTRVLFDTAPPMAASDHVVGAMIVTFAVIAMAEVGRPLRFVNVAFGLWLVVAPWVLDGASTFASWVSVVIGIAVVALSLPRGKRSAEHYGDWDRYVV